MNPALQVRFLEVYGLENADSIVWDGIVDPDIYRNQKTKILWFLREPLYMNSLDILRGLQVYSRIGRSPTLHVMAYVTFSILNSFISRKDMKDLRDVPEMADVLRGIAYINVKKTTNTSGTSLSNLGEIMAWFDRTDDLLKEQVSEVAPDIIIGSPPFMPKVMEWYGGKETNKIGEVASTTTRDGHILINAPHPSSRMHRSDLVDDIVCSVKYELQNVPAQSATPDD